MLMKATWRMLSNATAWVGPKGHEPMYLIDESTGRVIGGEERAGTGDSARGTEPERGLSPRP